MNKNYKYIQKIKKSFDFTNKKIVVGVSGGRDSVCLLHLINQIIPSENILVGHIHHHIRTDGSAEKDLLLSQELAKSLNCKFKAIHLTPPSDLSKATADWARNERRKALLDLCNDFDAQYLLLAHSLSDQAETSLMRFISSPGINALSGMESIKDNILRPLMWAEMYRDDCTNYCLDNDLKWNDDPYNEKTKRGKIRKIITELNEIDSCASKTMVKTSELAREDEDAFNYLAKQYLETHEILNIKDLRKEPIALVRRILRLYIESQMNFDCQKIPKHTEEILKMKKNTTVWLPHSVDVITDENYNLSFKYNNQRKK